MGKTAQNPEKWQKSPFFVILGIFARFWGF